MSPLRQETQEVLTNGMDNSNDPQKDSGEKERDSIGTYHPTGVQGTIAIETKPSASKPAPRTVQEQFNIEGKVFMVTGGGQGLGLAMAV